MTTTLEPATPVKPLTFDVPRVPRFGRQLAAKLALLGLAVGVLILCRGTLDAPDALVLGTIVLVVSGAARTLAALSSVLLWVVAFPPLALPTYWFCLVPVTWMSRQPSPRTTMVRVGVETLAIGFAAAWFSTGFVREAMPSGGSVAHAIGCFLFGIQLAVVGASLWRLRNRPVLVSAVISAAIAVAAEIVQAKFGVAWSVMSL